MKRRLILGVASAFVALMLGACGNGITTNPGTGGGSGIVTSSTTTSGETGAGGNSSAGGNSNGVGPGSGEDAAGNILNATSTATR